MMETAIAWIHDYEYPAIVVLLPFGIVGLPIPDETLLVFVDHITEHMRSRRSSA